jgi:hypothetical protein
MFLRYWKRPDATRDKFQLTTAPDGTQEKWLIMVCGLRRCAAAAVQLRVTCAVALHCVGGSGLVR